jgi:threonine dehydratase
LNKSCLVVMPNTSAQVKVQSVRDYGGQVDLIEVTQTSRHARVEELAKQYPEAYVASAYDDPLVIAGNATLGEEMARLKGPYDAVLAPVGGGGLTAGILTGLRAAGSNIPVWGAEPLLANDAARSLRAGRIITNAGEPQTIADGVRTLSLGQHNWAVLREGLAGIIEVNEERIGEAVRLLFTLANLKAEPTGALAVAAVLTEPGRFRSQSIICVVSGGNVDADLFGRILTSAS